MLKSSPKSRMTNRFAVLEEEDDCKMAHLAGLTGTYDVCVVQKSQKVEQLEVTVDSGAEESVWASQVAARDLHDNRRRRKEEVSCGKWSRRWAIMAERRSSLEVRRAM